MPETVNINGEDKVVYTQEEVAEQMTVKDNNITELQDKLKGFEGKDLNFGKLRESKEKVEEELAKALGEKADLQKQIDEGKTQQQTKEHKDAVASEIKKIAGDDKEMIEKVEFQFNRLGGNQAKPEEINKIVLDAYLLANPTSQAIDVLKQSTGGGQGPGSTPANNTKEGGLSDDLVPLANKMGITNEDIKKYGGKQ